VQLQSPDEATRVSQSVEEVRPPSPSRVTTISELGMPVPSKVASRLVIVSPGAGESMARGKTSEAVFRSVATRSTCADSLASPERQAWTSIVCPAYETGTLSENAPFSAGKS
jgi:hypothetical protein